MPNHLPFAGIPTFARAPIVNPFGDWQADVAVLGIPYDISLGYRPGARFGPRALREASLRSMPPLTSLDGKISLKDVTFADASDVILPSLKSELARERMTETAQAVRSRCRLPVFFGGDHSVTYSLLRAFDDVPDLHIVQLDAHLDFTDVRNDTRWSNSSAFRRACEDMPNLAHITTFGLRGLRFDLEAVAAARARGHTLIAMEDINADFAGILAQLPKGKNVYISIDVDGFDPAVVPATSSVEAEGLSYAQGQRILAAVARQNKVVGLDMVELAPDLDPTGRSALLMAQLLMATLGEIWEAR